MKILVRLMICEKIFLAGKMNFRNDVVYYALIVIYYVGDEFGNSVPPKTT